MTTYRKGATGIISLKVGEGYKPVVCVDSTSIDRVLEFEERVNYCTNGEKVRKITGKAITVTVEGSIVDQDTNQGYDELAEIFAGYTDESVENDWKIEGRGDDKFFSAYISNLSDTFPGEGGATFSMTLETRELTDNE